MVIEVEKLGSFHLNTFLFSFKYYLLVFNEKIES